jgi:predicted porin
MKFSKLSLAVALAVASVAAQAEVVLYGTVDVGMSYNNVTVPGASNSNFAMTSGQSAPTQFGIRGSEDLGNGNAVVFNVASRFNSSTGQTEDESFFSQQSTLGVRNAKWGQVDLGRKYNVTTQYMMSLDPFTTYYGQAGAGQSFSGANQVRYSNMVQYQTAAYKGFSAGLGYSFNTGLVGAYANNGVVTDGSQNFGTTNNARAVTLGARYDSGPVTVLATYDQVMPAGNIPGATPSSPKSWLVGGSYDFKVVKASLAYGQTRGGWITGVAPLSGTGVNSSWTNGGTLFSNGYGANSYLVGLSAPVGSASSVFGSVQIAQPTGSANVVGSTTQSVYSLGYNYNLSKRTAVYAFASYADGYAMVSDAKSTQVGVGLRHSF